MSHFIEVIGAKTHNLKNISVKIPKNKLVVITGVSGSGKSSLAFDTIYAEGQRRYLESLSTYARMIISSINEDAKVDEIRGLSPTISIDQKTTSNNPRSTVGTITEIYDFYRLLFTTIGTQKCSNHPEVTLKKHSISEVISFVKELPEATKIHVMAPIPFFQTDATMESIKRYVLDSGFVRFQINDTIYSVADAIEGSIIPENAKISIVIDRLVVKDEDSFGKRLRDSLEFAYKTGEDMLEIYELESKVRTGFSAKASCPLCGTSNETLSISNFSFNSPYGACESCHGLGTKVAFLEEKIINGNLTLEEGAILPWTNHMYYMEILRAAAKKHKINLNVPYKTLSKKARDIVLHGCTETFEVYHAFDGTESKIYTTHYE
jgi:excinuclease ABC subunit A